jgi:succinyl-diaminopimelate desuccinylase
MSIKNFLQEKKEELLQDLFGLLSINSEKGEPVAGGPFGAGVKEAVEYTERLCQKYGLMTNNIDGYALEADYGEGEPIFGILAHLDVVPAGDGWETPAYQPTIRDGKIYARGAIDDKGPAVAVIYALRYLIEKGVKLKGTCRLIFGTDEESGWGGLEYYFKKRPMVDFGVTPDGRFPVINAEKGILIFDIISDSVFPVQSNGWKILEIKGGNRPNMVPDKAVAVIEGDKAKLEKIIAEFNQKDKREFVLKEKEGRLEITSWGVSAHGSLPELGVNAISNLIDLLTQGLKIEDKFLNWIQEKIGFELNGHSLGVDFTDKESGGLIFNLGIISCDAEECKIGINIRYPVTYKDEEIYAPLEKALLQGWKIEKGHSLPPLYFPTDDEFINTLLEAYKEVTGDKEAKPLAIGGGTYARALKKGVAFGSTFPGEPEVAHQSNEFMSVENLLKNIEIYAIVIEKLLS